jgi:hypothetical protein
LDQEGCTLSDQVGVYTVDLVDAAFVLLVCCVKLRAQLFSHQSNKLYLLKFFLKNSCVAHQLSVVVADNRLSSSGVKFRTGFSLLLKLKLPAWMKALLSNLLLPDPLANLHDSLRLLLLF